MSDNVNFRALGIKLAQTHPALFVSLSGVETEKSESLPEQWVIDAVNYLPHNIGNAIKTVRNSIGLGLKEAKDVVENLTQTLGVRHNDYAPTPLESDTQRKAYKALLKQAQAVRLDKHAV